MRVQHLAVTRGSTVKVVEDRIHGRLAEKRYEEAFEILLAAYQDKVFRLAWSMLGNRALAEEAAQEVFIRIWKALPAYRREASLSTWIYAIARNLCLTALKADAVRRTVPLEDAAEPAVAQARESTLDLDLLLAPLPAAQRQVAMLYFMEDQSYEEVARMTGLPMGTVKSYLYRARKRLAEALVRDRMGIGER